MSVYLFILITSLSTPTGATQSNIPHFESIRCANELSRLLEKWDSKNEWRKILTGNTGYDSYQTPTGKLGTWLELYLIPNDPPILIRVSSGTRTKITWASSRCLPKLSLDTSKADSLTLSKSFTDADLETLLSTEKAGVLYIWSPHMPFSYRGWENILASAKKRSLKVTPILDPYASVQELPEIGKHHKRLVAKSRPLESLELLKRGVTTHYPSIVLFKNSQLIGPVYPGVKSEILYDKFLKDYLDEK